MSSSEYNRVYHKLHKEAINAKRRKYRADNSVMYKQQRKKHHKAYYSKNRLELIRKTKASIINNPAKRKAYIKLYYIKNKSNIIKKVMNYKKNRLRNDPIFRYKENISNLIRVSITTHGFSKKSKTFQILGCSFNDFKIHMEKQFKPGMNWNNHGVWHTDHRIPLSSAKTEEEILKLNHHSNLQPLWAGDNLEKSNKIAERYNNIIKLS